MMLILPFIAQFLAAAVLGFVYEVIFGRRQILGLLVLIAILILSFGVELYLGQSLQQQIQSLSGKRIFVSVIGFLIGEFIGRYTVTARAYGEFGGIRNE